MKFAEEFRDRELVANIAANIERACSSEWTLMEFCGTHTVSIFRHGLKSLLPDRIKLVSGPGCPVCVSSKRDIDRTVCLSDYPDSIVATYGDMMKVPGSLMNLAEKKARGADIRVVYSSYDAVELARKHPDRKVVFMGVGFETTAPASAAAVLKARELGLENFHILSLHKVTPPVIGALLEGGTEVDGFICPGHVCAIIGSRPLEPVAEAWKKPCVIGGFEPGDVMQSILMLIRQLEEGRSEVEIEYIRGVTPEGNSNALAAIDKVFRKAETDWRGIGPVPESGLVLKEEFAEFDASTLMECNIETTPDPSGCRCGDVLKGRITPLECPLFGKVCRPESPVGPCMVSSEGSCSTYYLYAGRPGAGIEHG